MSVGKLLSTSQQSSLAFFSIPSKGSKDDVLKAAIWGVQCAKSFLSQYLCFVVKNTARADHP